MTSNVKVIKTEEDELQIEFELENVGLCVFAAGKGISSAGRSFCRFHQNEMDGINCRRGIYLSLHEG